MRPSRNMSAPGMLLPSISTNSASTLAARRGNPIPICPKAARQAKMRPWPHFSDTNRTKNLFSDMPIAASSYGLAALTGPPSYDHGMTAAAFRYAKTRFTRACGLTPATRMVPPGVLQERVCTEKRANRESNANSTPSNCFHIYGPATEKDNYTRNSSSSRYKKIIPRYDRSRRTATEVPRPSSAPAMIQSTQSRVLVPSIDSTPMQLAQIDSPHSPLLDSPQRPSPHGASYHEAINVEVPTLKEV